MIDEKSAPPGTKVKCVDNTGTAQNYMGFGVIYEVERWLTIVGEVILKGVLGGSWKASRFDLASAHPTNHTVAIYNAGAGFTPVPGSNAVSCNACGSIVAYGAAAGHVCAAPPAPTTGIQTAAPLSYAAIANAAAAAVANFGAPPLLPFDDLDPVTPPYGTYVPSCCDCGLELCKELDAYWGPHPFLAEYCTKCRRKHEPHGANAFQAKR